METTVCESFWRMTVARGADLQTGVTFIRSTFRSGGNCIIHHIVLK